MICIILKLSDTIILKRRCWVIDKKEEFKETVIAAHMRPYLNSLGTSKVIFFYNFLFTNGIV